MRATVATLAPLGLLLLPATASADGAEGASLFPVSGNVRAGVEIETAAFRLQGRQGSYVGWIPRSEWAPLKTFTLRLRVPIYELALEQDEHAHYGPGDAELRLRFQLGRSDPLRITGGWVTQLPTGSTRLGLGEGGVQVLPFLSAGYKIDRTVLYVTVADAKSLAAKSMQPVQNWVDPGSDHELRTTFGSILPLTDVVSASANVMATTVLVHDRNAGSLLTGTLQIGAQPDRRLRLIMAYQLPLLGEQRFAWKLNAAATYAF